MFIMLVHKINDKIISISSSPHWPSVVSANGTLMTDSVPVLYTVGDFMTKKEDFLVVKPISTVDEGTDWTMIMPQTISRTLVEHRITGFPVIDDDWKLTFNEVQKLLSKTNGKLVGDLMTPAPVAVRETTNLEDAARLLLQTKYGRLPVVDAEGKVGIITRGNVVRAALQINRAQESLNL
ncbi:hypothetical protein K2173_021427 [Erythroxylum novogranatense]|uniref:CBS domain-containing protein n=1 Tax=Erythroxylum novogranatense TaxID=1862640 RepID=A0AAV8TX86_9ROSI|nr:hypothetical protein K2173_021427 [Erythroxylum novogranatense]